MSGITVFIQAALALLAAAGVLGLAWLAFGRLVVPVGAPDGPAVWAVVRGEGNGAGLEQAVHGLLWLRGGMRTGCTVLIVDDGLDEMGREVARALSRREEGVSLCSLETLPEEIQGAAD